MVQNLMNKFVFTLTFLISFSAAAKKSEGNLIREIDQARESVSQAEATQRRLYKRVLEGDSKVKSLSEERSKINNKVLSSEADSQELAFEVREWEQKVKDQRHKIAQSVAHIYQLKNPSLFTFIFSDQRASEIEKNVRFLKKISEKDFERFKSFQISLKEAKLAREKLKDEVRRLIGLREKLRLKENQLLADQKEMSGLLREIKSDKEKNLQLLRQLRSKVPTIDLDTKVALFERKGQLTTPIALPPTRNYGSLFDPDYRVKLLHLGWTYEHLFQTPVRAIFSGKVEYVGPLPGYGKTIVIDHGDHYYSLYTNNSSASVNEGESVVEGQPIAVSGSALYFELRHFSNAIDPAKWMNNEQTHDVAYASPNINGDPQ